MTQIYLNPYRPEKGDLRALRKLANNYRAIYKQYQSAELLQRDTAEGRWVAIESAGPGAQSVDHAGWSDLIDDVYARAGGLHLVTGSMNHGLPRDVLDMMDTHVYVPQFDDVPFLAPVSAAAIVMHTLFMRTANQLGVFG